MNNSLQVLTLRQKIRYSHTCEVYLIDDTVLVKEGITLIIRNSKYTIHTTRFSKT